MEEKNVREEEIGAASSPLCIINTSSEEKNFFISGWKKQMHKRLQLILHYWKYLSVVEKYRRRVFTRV